MKQAADDADLQVSDDPDEEQEPVQDSVNPHGLQYYFLIFFLVVIASTLIWLAMHVLWGVLTK